jgi:predicted nucleotidyltransferase
MSRPQRELQLIELLRSLTQSGVEFLIFGSVAAGLYGHVRATVDLDIIVHADEKNLDRVADWLESLDTVLALKPQRPFANRERWALHKGRNATVLTQLGQVDVVQDLPGLPAWEQLMAEAEVFDVHGLTLHAMNRNTLIELKRRRGSTQDLADIEAIELLDQL